MGEKRAGGEINVNLYAKYANANANIGLVLLCAANLDRFPVGSGEDVTGTHSLVRNHVFAGSHDEVGLNAVRLELGDCLVR